MHIVIDDTHGPDSLMNSRYVTQDRRTHVAIVFPDEEVDEYRRNIQECLAKILELFPQIKSIDEFHFSDVLNKRKQWKTITGQENLAVFLAFTEIYSMYKWPVEIQTIDERTLNDHRISIQGKIEFLDFSSRDHLSLFFLLQKIKYKYSDKDKKIHFIIDEGIAKSGKQLPKSLLAWLSGSSSSSIFMASSKEPLLQLVDFIAFCINRSTYLSTKNNRTEIDNWFLQMVGDMGINCPDLVRTELPLNFTVSEFDKLHDKDRKKKGLPLL